ncbi:hypothetical protein LINGRAHAP2_LOCUS16431 [Linum grandiflorum]
MRRTILHPLPSDCSPLLPSSFQFPPRRRSFCLYYCYSAGRRQLGS